MRQDEDTVVVTGSYNYTFSAQARNAENLLILRGNAALAARLSRQLAAPSGRRAALWRRRCDQ